MSAAPSNVPRLLLVVNVDWFFLSHRLPIARAALHHGFDVWVAAADTGRAGEIRSSGLHFVPLRLSRSGRNPLAELGVVVELARLYWRLRPDVVHHVTVKPVLYGSIAARLSRPAPAVVNAISGLGFLFSDLPGAGRLRRLLLPAYRIALASSQARAIFQNPDDLRELADAGLVDPARAVLIRGSGVNCQVFRPSPLPSGPPVVMLPARMLVDKGVREFVEAARILRPTHPDARFILVGAADDSNPAAIRRDELEAWVGDGVVEWWGQRDHMEHVLPKTTIVALPTYREGLPKALIEAAACARPLVASDVPGCREVVRHEDNGLLVPPRDATALASALSRLLASPERCREMGESGRRRAEREFAEELVVAQTLELYESLLASRVQPASRR